MNTPTTDTLLIGFDFTHGKDNTVLIVGRKRPNQSVDIVNAFQGEEAEELYKKLAGETSITYDTNVLKKENQND